MCEEGVAQRGLLASCEPSWRPTFPPQNKGAFSSNGAAVLLSRKKSATIVAYEISSRHFQTQTSRTENILRMNVMVRFHRNRGLKISSLGVGG